MNGNDRPSSAESHYTSRAELMAQRAGAPTNTAATRGPHGRDPSPSPPDGAANPAVPDDPWALQELQDDSVQWNYLTVAGKVKRVSLEWIGRAVALTGLLYLFICSLDFLSSAFRLLGGKTAGEVFSHNTIITNPVAGVMIGILATVLVQSSSTSTSIVVTMVASDLLDVQTAIPIIMGANIGTSVTNTIVSFAQSRDRNQFRRAFGGATVHDMFNWLTVIILLPVETFTGYLYRMTKVMVESYQLDSRPDQQQDLLKVITKPFTERIVEVDKDVISDVAKGDAAAASESLLKVWCETSTDSILTNVTRQENVTTPLADGTNITSLINVTSEEWTDVTVYLSKCDALFNQFGLSDVTTGCILLALSLFILCMCLIFIVKILNSIFKGKVAAIIKRTINSDFPGKLSFLTGYLTILVGAGMTILVQSSSIFTSTLTPLVGIGVISIDRMYPLTLGANIGTTVTAILAALTSSGDKLQLAIQIALCHLFFNITGILIWYPVPFMRRCPIRLAKFLGDTTSRYRWFALFYLLIMFFLTPTVIFTLTYFGYYYLLGFGVPFICACVFIFIVNVIQRKAAHLLPRVLRTWEFLPLCLHSLQPLDDKFTMVARIFKRCACAAQATPVNGCVFTVDGHTPTHPTIFIEPPPPPGVATSNGVNQSYNSDQFDTAL